MRVCARHQKRVIRFPRTDKGALHWTELVAGKWCRFKAPLSLKYAAKVDGFDRDYQHFSAPARCPMGPVQFVGFGYPPKPVTHTRRGYAGNRGKGRGRGPQLPFVLAMSKA